MADNEKVSIEAEIDVVVTEVLSLSSFIKFTLVLLCILIVVVTIRYLAFGCRVATFKLKDWLKANEAKPAPQVIILSPFGLSLSPSP